MSVFDLMSGPPLTPMKEDVPPSSLEPAAPPPAVASAEEGEEIYTGERVERRVPMTRLRASIARRLVEAQQNAAILTTFNEVNMKPVMDLRSRYKEQFEKTHNGTRLGFMGFFVKAACEALKRFPEVNASIDGNDIVYHGYFDIGIAVGGGKGLVVPVIRSAERLSFAQVESVIADFGSRARANRKCSRCGVLVAPGARPSPAPALSSALRIRRASVVRPGRLLFAATALLSGCCMGLVLRMAISSRSSH